MLGLLNLNSRIYLYVAIAIAIVGAYFLWKHNIEQQALMEYNQRQLEQVIRDQRAFQDKMQEVQEKQRTIENDLTAQNELLNNNLKNVNDYLNSSEVKKVDVPSSPILKNTIKQLRSEKK